MIKETLWMGRRAVRTLREQRYLRSREVAAWRRFWRSYHLYQGLAATDQQPLLSDLYPCLGDDTAETPIEPVYFYQDAWAFEKIVKQKPATHVDVGSHHKFVALLSKVVPVTMVDIRPLSLPLETLQFRAGSILEMPYQDNSVASLSSLCVVEHIGLGRYGDSLDPNGSEKAIAELRRILAPRGRLYFSVPVGERDLTAFNAGRVFSIKYLQQIISPLIITDQRFIVGNCYQDAFAPHHGVFGTTGLFELMKPER